MIKIFIKKVKIMKTIPIMLLVSIILFCSCEKGEDTEKEAVYTDVMANQIKNDLVEDATISPYEAIFDVSPAYDKGHLPFATNINGVAGLENMLDDLNKSKSYLVYCHSDEPSIAGAVLLTDNGFTNVHRLKGNYAAWDEVSFVDVAASEVKAKIEAGDFEAIFDVSPHFIDGHLPGAINAYVSGGGKELAELISDLDKTKSYLVYCHANLPAMAGAQLITDAGFNKVYRLEGNYASWVSAGYAVE